MDRKGNYNDNFEIKRLNLLSQIEDLVKFPKNSSSDQEKLFQEILKKSRKTILFKLCLKHTPKLNEFEIEYFNETSNSFKQFYIDKEGNVINGTEHSNRS